MFKQYFDKIQNFLYYLIILVVSVLSTAFLPFIGSTINLNYTPPTNGEERTIFIFSRLIIGGLNVIIYYCFTKQAEVNVKDDKNYREACEKLDAIKKKKPRNPRSPAKFKAIQRSTKATTICLSSVVATFTLAGIVLHFDLVQLLVYIFVITMGIVFGIITMKNHEYYWTHEYLDYANMIEKQNKEEDHNGLQNERQNLS